MSGRFQIVILMFAGSLISATVVAQDLFVYPQKGQDNAQMDKDKYECYQWARQQTGVDPVRGAPAQEQQQSTVGRGMARGALGGLAIGNIAGGSGSKGAAAGALLGGVRSGAQDSRRRSSQQQSAAQSQQSYDRAYGACLEGRGYTVR